MVNDKPEKYNYDNFIFTKTCQLGDQCKEHIVKCLDKKCIKSGIRGHKYGHYGYYINSDKQTVERIEIILVVKHAHFVISKITLESELDKGRNIWCEVNRLMIPKTECEITYRLPRNKPIPQWIRDKLEGKSN